MVLFLIVYKPADVFCSVLSACTECTAVVQFVEQFLSFALRTRTAAVRKPVLGRSLLMLCVVYLLEFDVRLSCFGSYSSLFYDGLQRVESREKKQILFVILLAMIFMPWM